MRSIAKYLEPGGGSYDQVNLAGLACFEHMARRWQLIMEAHKKDPTKPDYDSAVYFVEEAHEKTGVPPPSSRTWRSRCGTTPRCRSSLARCGSCAP